MNRLIPCLAVVALGVVGAVLAEHRLGGVGQAVAAGGGGRVGRVVGTAWRRAHQPAAQRAHLKRELQP